MNSDLWIRDRDKYALRVSTIVQEDNTQGFKTREWGPMLWFVLHMSAVYADEHKTKEKQQTLFWLLAQLRMLMFCVYCRESFSVFWSSIVAPRLPTPTSQAWMHRSSSSLSTLVSQLHALVNLKLGKEMFPTSSSHTLWGTLVRTSGFQVQWIKCILYWMLLVTCNLCPDTTSVWRLRQETTLFRVLTRLGSICQCIASRDGDANDTNTHSGASSSSSSSSSSSVAKDVHQPSAIPFPILYEFGRQWNARILPYLTYDRWKDVPSTRAHLFVFVCCLFRHADPVLGASLVSHPVRLAQKLESWRVK